MKAVRAFLFFPLAVCLFLACDAEKEPEDYFNQSCGDTSDCPEGWICLGLLEDGYGKIGGICSPICSEDADCKSTLGRVDVFCLVDICAQECEAHSACPDELPYCRGSHPSCDPLSGPDWCSTEDFICDFN